MKKKVFIACDTQNIKKAKKIIQLTSNSQLNIGYKFGLEFFNSKKGRSFISKINKNKLIWLDLKLNDIPNTVASSINALIEKGSQIILSADRAPNKLTRIQERIKSRFSGGLVVDIQKPDYELRYKIIKSKTDELKLYYSNQVNITKEIQEFISNEIRTSIRELVGALNRIVSYSRIYNKVPSLSEVRVILKDLLNLSENKVTIDLIQTIVCKFFKISKNEMLSPRRSRYLVRPRQTAIYLAKTLTSKSLPEIGRAFSNRDHTTVIHSVKTIDKLRKEDNELNINIGNLKNKILYKQENEI